LPRPLAFSVLYSAASGGVRGSTFNVSPRPCREARANLLAGSKIRATHSNRQSPIAVIGQLHDHWGSLDTVLLFFGIHKISQHLTVTTTTWTPCSRRGFKLKKRCSDAVRPAGTWLNWLRYRVKEECKLSPHNRMQDCCNIRPESHVLLGRATNFGSLETSDSGT
jgi:hypothetical protein